LGAEPSAMSSADFSSWLRNEIAASAKVVRDEKITID
ncbi:MAG: tripartite tricarboxylate transporter substrate binding protein, partial [Betaproteobacteria bacterium]|nr:tripartite tricarboxylate transporter substrate binding protein [Betaproteobacteria bacterium]